MGTATNWNIRITGAYSDSYFGYGRILLKDVIGDSKKDLIVSAGGDDNNSRTNSGSVYIIENSLFSSLTGTGNGIDLSSSSSYSIRIDGATAGDQMSYAGFDAADIDGDGKNDLILGAAFTDNNGRSNSGSVYVINNTLLRGYSGTGNTHDLAVTSKWTIRYDSAVAGDQLGYNDVDGVDLNNNGKADLFLGAAYATRNGRSYSGAIYLIYDSLIDDYSGTGNIVDLATSTNWNLRYDGPGANWYIGEAETNIDHVFDLDNDNKSDLIIYGDSDYAYIIFNSLFDDYSGTGNALDLATASTYNLRYQVPGGGVEGPPTIADFNGNGKNDLVISDGDSEPSHAYIMYDSLLDDYSGTGNDINLSTSTNYNVRIQSVGTYDYIGYNSSFVAGDYNGDGKKDLYLTSDINSVFVVNNTIFSALSGTGNTVLLSTAANLALQYNGAILGDYLGGSGGIDLGDVNGDGADDFLVSAPYYSNGGSRGALYVIFNFPHTITTSFAGREGSSVRIQGTVSASSSVTTIANVQYRVDSNDPTATWTSCTPDDGSYSSRSEAFKCSLSSYPTNDGHHTIYVRAYDTNGAYTAQSNYYTFQYDIGNTSAKQAGPQIPSQQGGVFAPLDESTNPYGQKVTVILEPETFKFNAFLSSTISESSQVVTSKVKSNSIFAGSILGIKAGKGISWQIGPMRQVWYKAYAAATDKEAAKIIPDIQNKPSIIALTYNDSDLVPPGKPKSKFNTKNLKLAYSVDGITWKILPTSVVDSKNHTVAALHKIGGYYMVVGK
jgi:hypothetical protein